METNLCAGDRAFMKVGRNIVEVRVLEKVGTCWQVSTRTGKTMYARELGEGEVAHGPGPVAALAMIPNWSANAPRNARATAAAADAAEAPATPSGGAVTATAPASAETPVAAAVAATAAKGISLLSAAATVLERSATPMAVKPIIEEAKTQGLWIPTGGKTPEQTLYSAIVREIKNKSEASRFRREDKGRFSFVHRP